jgi:hypothetical protein
MVAVFAGFTIFAVVYLAGALLALLRSCGADIIEAIKEIKAYKATNRIKGS